MNLYTTLSTRLQANPSTPIKKKKSSQPHLSPVAENKQLTSSSVSDAYVDILYSHGNSLPLHHFERTEGYTQPYQQHQQQRQQQHYTLARENAPIIHGKSRARSRAVMGVIIEQMVRYDALARCAAAQPPAPICVCIARARARDTRAFKPRELCHAGDLGISCCSSLRAVIIFAREFSAPKLFVELARARCGLRVCD